MLGKATETPLPSIRIMESAAAMESSVIQLRHGSFSGMGSLDSFIRSTLPD
jgi:hypothetical protein